MHRTFDRLVKFDERSRQFPIRALVAPGLKARSYTWSCPIVLNQGAEGACTGFATAHELAARPCVVRGVNNEIARAIYRRARELDEFPGEAYEGSSVLGAFKAAQEAGWIKEYRWAFGETDLSLALGYKGPAVLGINWYAGMSDPDPATGLLVPSGRLSGGHAILCNGYNHPARLYRLHNSWGPGWGTNGEAWIRAGDLAALLADQGEAAIPVVRGKGRAA